MIICGYQGIGKSTIAGQLYTIDLESSNFYIDGKRDEKWYKVYANFARHLSEQGEPQVVPRVYELTGHRVRDRIARARTEGRVGGETEPALPCRQVGEELSGIHEREDKLRRQCKGLAIGEERLYYK